MCFIDVKQLDDIHLKDKEICIKKIRNDLSAYLENRMTETNLKQRKLAKLSGMSQPGVSKIISEKGNPSFSTVMWLICTIEKEERERETKNYCGNHMVPSKEILWASVDQVVTEISSKMLLNGISQVPVYNKGTLSKDGVIRLSNVVGILTESDILRSERNKNDTNVGLIMQRRKMSTVTENKRKEDLIDLLLEEPAALVVKGNAIKGIITKSDLLSPPKVSSKV